MKPLHTTPLRCGLGLRSPRRTHPSAFWASWADLLHMVQKRHPGVVGHLLAQLEGVPVGQSLTSASAAARSLDGVDRFDTPSCPENHEPGSPRQGKSKTRLTDMEKTMLRSQSRSGCVLVHHSRQSADEDRLIQFQNFSAADFALLFLCRHASEGVAAPLIPWPPLCCMPVRGFWCVGFCSARICREGGWRVATNRMPRPGFGCSEP